MPLFTIKEKKINMVSSIQQQGVVQLLNDYAEALSNVDEL